MVIAAIAAFTGAGLMLILSILGIWHLRRAAPEAEVFPRLATRAAAERRLTTTAQPSAPRPGAQPARGGRVRPGSRRTGERT